MGKNSLKLFLPIIIFIVLLFEVGVANAISPPVIDQDHLVLWFRFDEGNGTTVYDFSGNGNNGTIYGANWTVGRYGYALSFDGVDDYVEVPDSESLNITKEITITAWIKLTDGGDRSTVDYIVGKRKQYVIFQNDAKYSIEGCIINSTGAVFFTGRFYLTNLPNPDDWHFIAVIYDGSELSLWVDGVKRKSVSASGDIAVTTNPLSIGKYLLGAIDEVRIYNRALSPEEIKAMYEALRVKFYDESNGEKIKANATIFNANHSINLQVDSITKEAVLFHSQVPEYSEYYLTATADGYATRHRVIQLSNDSLTEVDVYLPKSSESIANVIAVNDIVGELTGYQNYIRLSVGNKPIEEQKLQYGSSPTELRADVYLLKSKPYIITVYNERESRCLGWIYPSLDGYIYLHVSQLNYSKIRGDLPVQYNVTSTNETIRVWYKTIYGETTSAKVVITDRNGTVVFEQTLNTPEGVVTFLKNDSDEDYIVKLEIDNSVEKVKYSNLVLGSKLAIKLPQLDVGIEGYDFATLPAWMRATFFGGLCIFTALLFKKRYVPVGLTLSLALAVIFNSLGILELPQTLLLALTVLVGLAYFVWWRKREEVIGG